VPANLLANNPFTSSNFYPVLKLFNYRRAIAIGQVRHAYPRLSHMRLDNPILLTGTKNGETWRASSGNLKTPAFLLNAVLTIPGDKMLG
jgi:hypothetical protein